MATEKDPDAALEGLNPERFKRLGQGVQLNGQVLITHPENVEIGDNVHIGHLSVIDGRGGVFIGANTHISRNFLLYSVNHNYRGERLPYDDQFIARPVHIGANVWIGHGVCIQPGATIGEGAIVGMGCVVSGVVPPLSVIAPPRWVVVGMRDPLHYARLVKAGAFGGPNGETL